MAVMTIADSSVKRRLIPVIAEVLVIGILALVVSGCSSLVGVKHVDIQTAYNLNTESALSAGQPSEASKTVLRRHGLMDRFEKEPALVLAELHAGLTHLRAMKTVCSRWRSCPRFRLNVPATAPISWRRQCMPGRSCSRTT